MSGIAPIGPAPIEPSARQHAIERARERYYDDPEQHPDAERRRKRKKGAEPPEPGISDEHVDVRA